MQNSQAGGNQEAAIKQVLQFVQQAFQKGAKPDQVAQALLSQQIPPQIVVQIFVQMGMDQAQATSAVQAAAQGGGPQADPSQGQQQMQGAPQQGPQEEQMEGPQGQNPQEEQMEQPPMGRWGGTYDQGGMYDGGGRAIVNREATDPYGTRGIVNRGPYDSRGLVNAYGHGGPWNGTFSGNQGFAYGGVNPYMYNDPYSYMEMGGMIPYAQYGMEAGVPPRPQPEQYPDYATFKAEDDSWVVTYGDQAMDYSDNKWNQDNLGYGNPNLAMIPDNLPVSIAGSPVSGPSPFVPNESTPDSRYNNGVTVRDWLASRGIPSSYAVRKDIANKAGIQNYTGQPAQDAVLLDKLKVAEQNGQLSSGTPTTAVAAGAPVKYANNKSKITSNVSSQKALHSLAAKSAAINANPNNYNIPATDSIPTVRLDSIPTMDSIPTPIDLSDTSGMPQDTAYENLNPKLMDSNIRQGIILSDKDKANLLKSHNDNLWKTVALTGTNLGLGYAWKSYKNTKKSVGKVTDILKSQADAENVKEGELLAEINKKYNTPESIMDRAKQRGGWYTADEKVTLDAVTDKKLKAEIKKLKFNQNADSKSVLTADMVAEGWGPGNDFFSPDNKQKIAAHLDDNLKQAEDIIKAAETRGFKTAADIKKLRQLMDNESIMRLTAGIPRPILQSRFDRFVIKGGDMLENIGDKLSTKYSDLSARASKIKTDLKGGIKKAFTPKYDFVPGAGLEGTNAWRTLMGLGNIADIEAGGVEIEEAQYVLANKTQFPKKNISAAEATLKQNNITPEFQNIVAAYTQQKGEMPSSNIELVDQYHVDLESGVRTPLVEAIESGTGIASTKQRTGVLGNTFDGMKKAKNAVGSGYNTLTTAFKTGAKTATDKAAFWSDAFAGKLGNLGTSISNVGTSISSIPSNLRNKIQQRGNAKIASQIYNSTNPNLTSGTPDVITQPTELQIEQFLQRAKRNVGRPKKIKVGEIPMRNPNLGSGVPENITSPIELSVEGAAKTESAGKKVLEMLRTLGKGLRRKEYGGSMMAEGGYVPNYAMAYGGIPEAMYGMGMAEGGMYEDGGSPLFSTQGQQLRNYMNTAAYTHGGWMPNHFELPPVGFNAHYSPTQVKRANFARNAASWKHQQGGLVAGQEMEVTPEQLQMLKDGGYQFQIMH